MKVSNKIFNDINYTSMDFNVFNRMLVVGDFAGYLMTMYFNNHYGDIEEEGISYKKKSIDIPLAHQNQIGSTYYIQYKKKQHNNNKNIIVDPPLSKQRKTVFSNIIQNTGRFPLELIVTKQKTIFTYQGKFHNIIKIWDIFTLRVYQKIDMSIKINEMKISNRGLFLISSQKGYLCYYAFQKIDNNNNKRIPLQVLEMRINSNILFISTTNMVQNIVYKLRLSNKPILSQYFHKSINNVDRSLKFAFYKNQTFTFNIDKIYSPFIQINGVFGQSKQIINDLKDYYSMIAYPQKQGIILLGHKRICIRCKPSTTAILHRKFTKGQNVILNYNQDEQFINKQQVCANTILFDQNITKIKVFLNYILILCNKDNKTVGYLIDENTLSLCVIYPQFDSNIRILQAHKVCSMFIITNNKNSKNKNNKVKTKNKGQYFLLAHQSDKLIWRSQQIQGWVIEGAFIQNVSNNQVDIVCIYKSTSLSLDENKQKQQSTNKQKDKPFFYLIVYKLKLITKQKHYVNLGIGLQKYSQSQTQNINDIAHRSIYQKISKQVINRCLNQTYNQNNQVSKKIYKIFFPDENIFSTKEKQLDIKMIQGKILYYNKQQNTLMFAMTLGGIIILYAMSQQIIADIIGVLDLNKNNNNNLKYQLQQSVVYWNKQYKKDDEEMWENTKIHALKRVKNRRQMPPILLRSDSLRTTQRIWNPQILNQPIITQTRKKSVPKKSKSQMKLSQKNDPVRINQLIYKNNIHQQIVKQNAQKQQNQRKQKLMKQKNRQVRQSQIRGLTSTIRMTKQTLFSQWRSSQKASKGSIRKMKTQQSEPSHQRNTSSTYELTKMKRPRYETQALQQLQKSKLIQQKLLPKIKSGRKQTLRIQKQKKNMIYDLLKKQTFSLQQSRYIQSRLQK